MEVIGGLEMSSLECFVLTSKLPVFQGVHKGQLTWSVFWKRVSVQVPC